MRTRSKPRLSAARRIERIRLGLTANIEDIPALAELASMAVISRSQLSRNFRRSVGAAHFDKAFRRRFGITPGEFRRRYGKVQAVRSALADDRPRAGCTGMR